MELRDYQERIVSSTIQALENYKRPFIVSAFQSSGKSIMIAELARRVGEPVLVLCMNGILVEQNAAKMRAIGIEPAIFSASCKSKEIGDITIGTIQSIYRTPELFERFGLVIVDESQMVPADDPNSMYMKLLTHIKPKLIGWTGTPMRNVSKMRGREVTTEVRALNRVYCKTGFLWSNIYHGIGYAELLEQGFVSPTKYYVDRQDTSMLKVNSTGADFTEDSLEQFGKATIERVVEVASKVVSTGMAKKVLVCVPTIDDAVTAQELTGARSGALHSKLPSKERSALLDAFTQATGHIDIMYQVGILNTGYDNPALDAIVFARPTLSPGLYSQICGRVIRKDPNNPEKVGLIFDLVGVSQMFGRGERIRTGIEEGYKTTIVGDRGQLSGRALSSFVVRS